MMPIPILVLLSAVGLVAYVCIGCVVGTISAHYWDSTSNTFLNNIANGKLLDDDNAGFRSGMDHLVLVASFWPVALVLYVVVGSAYLAVRAPAWVGARVAKYTANAILERKAGE